MRVVIIVYANAQDLVLQSMETAAAQAPATRSESCALEQWMLLRVFGSDLY